MMTPIYCWTGGRASGAFRSPAEAILHCRTLANDHRRNIELVVLPGDVTRYCGPRGRRHGIRLVAYIGPAAGLELLGVDVVALRRELEGVSA